MKWISVKDRLPDDQYESSYLVICKYKACTECDVAYIDEDDFWREEKYDRKVPVTHWMPLPKPPEE